jgi:DNA invertase Pin-like site-specific DNA recombinase
MAIIGYARTSRLKQEAGLAAQQRDLEAAGCTKVFSEQASSVAERPELERAIDYLREGDADVFVVTKLDRFARSISDAIELEKRIAAKGATLRILGTGIDTSTPVGRMMFGMLAVVAQFEREIMLERQREGIAAAAAAGKYKGRKPINADRVAEVRRLALEEKLGKAEIARRMKAAGTPVSLRSVFSILGSAAG